HDALSICYGEPDVLIPVSVRTRSGGAVSTACSWLHLQERTPGSESPYAPITSRSAPQDRACDSRAALIGRPSASTLSNTTSTLCRDKFLVSSSTERLVSITFSFVTVTIRIFFALSRIGIESAIARAALRLKSHAITIVLSSNGRGCSFSGRIKVGFPDLNMIASAYH